MAESTVHPVTRGERKERTRRAILDAALELGEDSGLGALSLRRVARQVGIVPTAFYRHFDSIDALGLSLVDEAFVSLRAMLRAVRRLEVPPGELPGLSGLHGIVDGSIEILVAHVHAQRGHLLFIARERLAGPPAVRTAIRREIATCAQELAADLAHLPGTEQWSSSDLLILSDLIVTAMVATSESILSASPEAEPELVAVARTQLRMVLIGALNWRSRPPSP